MSTKTEFSQSGTDNVEIGAPLPQDEVLAKLLARREDLPKRKILFILGTRPDCLKLAILIKELGKFRQYFAPVVAATSQHMEMLQQVLDLFNLKVDYNLKVMTHKQTLAELSARCLEGLESLFSEVSPDLVVVQGDTTTSAMGALAAFYRKIPVAHVEAGLRSFDKFHPFPEEINRIYIDAVSELLFAPTHEEKEILKKEGIEKGVYVTGNTGIDAYMWAAGQPLDFSNPNLKGLDFAKSKVVLVTAHRREMHGEVFAEFLRTLVELTQKYPQLVLVYPVHLNPNVKEPAYQILSGKERIVLVEPLNYLELVHLMQKSYFILTDSGGIQEEAPVAGKPVLVLRKVTERRAGVAKGIAKMVAMDKEKILQAVHELMTQPEVYEKMSQKYYLYGDGQASTRIVHILSNHFGFTNLPYLEFCEREALK